jgi:hypothetical protein
MQANPDGTRIFQAGRYTFEIDLLGDLKSVTEYGAAPTSALSIPVSLINSADVAVLGDGSRVVVAGHYVIHFTLSGKVLSVTPRA